MLECDDQARLALRYNQSVPRYTSYPTMPFWKNDVEKSSWIEKVSQEYNRINHVSGIAIYIHLPFCEKLCTYCGCNKKITDNHSVEEPYIDAVLKEWKIYRSLMKQTPVIRELHLGGGTPTFFSPINLRKLVSEITKGCVLHPNHQFSFEGHPNNTTSQHLMVLAKAGFNRVSYGVQDNDPDVQKIINRIQPLENVINATEEARRQGFKSVNFDLIYGLPRQTVNSIAQTMQEVIRLKPDRIAFYSYAHVPWNYKAQRLFDEKDLPSPAEKLRLYNIGRELLTRNGYQDIGMDHFSLPTDELVIAKQAGRLHRNFMGYTTQDAGILIGLGVSAISDIGIAFAQNSKKLHEYYAAINHGDIPISKGSTVNENDLVVRKYILDISCKGKTAIENDHRNILGQRTLNRLEGLEKDGLIDFDGINVSLTETGTLFTRNVCSAFDQYFDSANTQSLEMTFSKAV